MKSICVHRNHIKSLLTGLLSVLSIVIAPQAISQNLANPWVPIHVAADNTAFLFHAETIKFFSVPPKLVTFNLLSVKDGKASNYDRYEASCNTAEIKVNGSAFIAIGSENTARHLILRALCGFAADDGYWIGLLSEYEGPRKNLIYFVNVMSIIRVGAPFPGYSAQGIVGVWKHGKNPPFELTQGRSQWSYTCKSPHRYAAKEPSSTDFGAELTVASDSPLGGVLNILCGGQFPIMQQAVNNTPELQKDNGFNSSSLEDAKGMCKELGFKPASEKFGDCVLKLSR